MKKIYAIIAMITCIFAAIGLAGCKKDAPADELNDLPLSDIFEFSTAGDEYYYTNEEVNAMCSDDGHISLEGAYGVTNLKAKRDVTIKSVSLSASLLYDSEAWIEIRKYQSDTILESEKKNVLKNTFYDFSITSEEGITFKKGTKFHLHINYDSVENTFGKPVANTIKNLKFTFM